MYDIKENTGGRILGSLWGLFCWREGDIGRRGLLEKEENNLNTELEHTRKVRKVKYRITTKKYHFTFFGDTKALEELNE